ncbi:MAG TPA: AAA family ATPase [Gemmatimonadales bacterium]
MKLFGHPDLLDGAGNPVPFRARKHLAVLVYLLIEGRRRPVSRGRLAALLWPDVPERQAFHSLSQALSELRGLLGSHTITRGNRPVRLAEAPASDLDQLREGWAIADSLSEPLLEFDAIAGVEWAHWIDQARAHCQESARRALSARLERHRALGEVRVVSECAAALYQVDPLSESAATALAEQYLLEGRTRDATDLLHRHADRCRRETGADQGAVLRLLQRIQADSRRKIEVEPPSRLALSIPQEVVIGREREFAWLESHWQATCLDGPRAVLVHGPPGIGKTSLLEEMTKRTAARAWPAFMVGCEEIGREIPFATTSEIMHAFAKDAAVGGTDPAWLAEAARVTPSLRLRYPGIPEPPPAPPESVQIRVAESLVRMLDAVAEGTPVLLAVDDIHQIDPTSGEVLHLLLRRLDGRPLLLVGSATTAFGPYGEGDDGSYADARLTWADALTLSAMSEDDIDLMLQQVLEGSQLRTPIRRVISRLAQGNPHLAEALARDWEQNDRDSLAASEFRGQRISSEWAPPPTLVQALSRLRTGLSQGAHRILAVLAVAGRRIPIKVVSETLGTPLADLEADIQFLLGRGLVRSAGGTLAIKNAVHRAVVYAQTGPELRDHIHRRIAAYVMVQASEGFQDQLEASHHLERASRLGEAGELALGGARAAIRSGAPLEAEGALRRILERTPDATPLALRIELARSLAQQGRYHDALLEVNRPHSIRMTQEENLIAALVRAESLQRGRLGDDIAIQQAAAEALHLAEASRESPLRIEAIQIAAEVAAELEHDTVLSELAQSATELAEESADSSTRASAQVVAGFCYLMQGGFEEAALLFRTLSTALSGSDHDLELRRAFTGQGIAATALGYWREAIDSFDAAARISERLGDNESLVNSLCNLAAVQNDIGLGQGADDIYRRAFEVSNDGISPRRDAELAINAAGRKITIGNWASASELIAAARTHARASQLWRLLFDTFLLEADLHLAQSDLESAVRCFESAERVRSGRATKLANAGRYERLKRQVQLVSNSIWESLRGFETRAPMKIADRLEVETFCSWMDAGRPTEGPGLERVWEPLVQVGLPGLQQYLSRVLCLDVSQQLYSDAILSAGGSPRGSP